jgi:hypothetical protein
MNVLMPLIIRRNALRRKLAESNALLDFSRKNGHLQRIFRALRSLESPHDGNKNDCTNGGDYDVSDKASGGIKAQKLKKETTNECTEHTNYKVTNEAIAAAFDQDASQPTGD